MNSKISILLLIILVVVGGYYVVQQNNSEPEEVTDLTQKDGTKDGSFTPVAGKSYVVTMTHDVDLGVINFKEVVQINGNFPDYQKQDTLPQLRIVSNDDIVIASLPIIAPVGRQFSPPSVGSGDVLEDFQTAEIIMAIPVFEETQRLEIYSPEGELQDVYILK